MTRMESQLSNVSVSFSAVTLPPVGTSISCASYCRPLANWPVKVRRLVLADVFSLCAPLRLMEPVYCFDLSAERRTASILWGVVQKDWRVNVAPLFV